MPQTPSRILLISPEFYGFKNEIQVALKDMGYDVSWINNKELPLDYHGTKSKFKIFRRIYFFLFFPQIRYLKRELNKLKDKSFDLIFSINCHIICPYLFRELRKRNPGIKPILFLWDSSLMYSWEEELKYFDKVFTFDPVDSVKFKLEYKPNFYIKSLTDLEEGKTYDLFFAGKFSTLRLSFIDKIYESIFKGGVDSYFRLWAGNRRLLHNKLIYRLLKSLRIAGDWVNDFITNFEAVEGILKRDFIIRKALSFQEVQQQMKCANVILDIPFNGQSGYSHRLIEALANGKKVITTNVFIKSEKFYNPNQIHLSDPQDPKIDFEWVQDRVLFPVHDYIKDLELSVWLKSILNVEISR